MTSSMRDLLLSSLSVHMSAMSEAAARSLAHDLTCKVSEHIGDLATRMDMPSEALANLACFPRNTWGPETLGVPWEAFKSAFGVRSSSLPRSEIKALCSAPAELDRVLSGHAAVTGMWGGSLLAALGRLLGGAREDLAIASPYWRVDGVRSLLSTAGRQDYFGLQVRVFTQMTDRMKQEDRQGLAYFVQRMRELGAVVRTFTPQAVGGLNPFLHAKLLIADSALAYVGSANFTGSGMEHGIEAGVEIAGEVAMSFANWTRALEAACVTE